MHLKTTVTTLFGIVDDNDDVIEQHPFKVELAKLDPELLASTHATLSQARERLKTQVASRPAPLGEKKPEPSSEPPTPLQ